MHRYFQFKNNFDESRNGDVQNAFENYTLGPDDIKCKSIYVKYFTESGPRGF